MADRIEYANKLELMLTLVGYAVGLGNIWRFPYLAFQYGGGAFLIPYALALAFLGLPLFVLELGLGQMLRQGTLGVWSKLELPRLQGVGAAATLCTMFVSLYYNVIIAWTVYYIGRTTGALLSGGRLPWASMGDGGEPCPETTLYIRSELASDPTIIDATTGYFNRTFAADFWCPKVGIPKGLEASPAGYSPIVTRPTHCPAQSAVNFWSHQALQQSSGMDDLGGFHWGMLLSFTVAWVMIYFCIFNGVKSSGKVVYVTALLPYVALIAFFFRAITLPNAMVGIRFFIEPEFSILFHGGVWMRAVTQIFYSLGVGFGSLIAFASFGSKHSNFVADATKVSLINCGTSIFAGFVVFPILGYLTYELSDTNPCIQSDNLNDLNSVGLSGTGLAFIAFPIAISRMPGGFFWALLFFLMLISLGIDSQFAMVESVVTVLSDAGIGSSWPRWKLSGAVCILSYLLGLIFVTRGGIYWFELFDNYACVIAMFAVTGLECCGLMWRKHASWVAFRARVQDWVGIELGPRFVLSWKYVCPSLLALMSALSLKTWDIMGASESERFPQGKGYFPAWSIWVGWCIGLLPLALCAVFAIFPPAVPKAIDDALEISEDSKSTEPDIKKQARKVTIGSMSTQEGGISEPPSNINDEILPDTLGNKSLEVV